MRDTCVQILKWNYLIMFYFYTDIVWKNHDSLYIQQNMTTKGQS
jgi:hypothetical protein